MKYQTIKSTPITQLINPEAIHSIVEIHARHGNSLAIAIKGSHPYAAPLLDYDGPYFPMYGNPEDNRITCYIPLSHFSNHAEGVAIPREFWDSIKIVTKKALYDDGTCAGTFSKAVLTKKITW